MSILDRIFPKKKEAFSQEELLAQLELTIQSYIDTHKSSDPDGVRKAYVEGMIVGAKMAGKCWGVNL